MDGLVLRLLSAVVGAGPADAGWWAIESLDAPDLPWQHRRSLQALMF